jgi:hypothetical protein
VRWTLALKGRKRVVLASASRTLAHARTVEPALRLTAAGRRTLARRRPAGLVLRTRFTAAGRTTHLTTAVRLRR